MLPTSHNWKIHLNIILQFMPSLLSGLFALDLPTKTLHAPLLSPQQN